MNSHSEIMPVMPRAGRATQPTHALSSQAAQAPKDKALINALSIIAPANGL